MQLGYSIGVGVVDMQVSNIGFGLRHMGCRDLGYMHLGNSIGVGDVDIQVSDIGFVVRHMGF